jgi:hypothetical protein
MDNQETGQEKTLGELYVGPSTIFSGIRVGKASSKELLDISKKIDQFVTDNGWSWCDMRQVYRILEVIHG